MVWLLFKCPQMYNKVWLSSLYCSMRNLCENNKQGRTSVLLPLAILICLYTKITKFPSIGAMQNGGGRLEHIGTDDKNEKHTSQTHIETINWGIVITRIHPHRSSHGDRTQAVWLAWYLLRLHLKTSILNPIVTFRPSISFQVGEKLSEKSPQICHSNDMADMGQRWWTDGWWWGNLSGWRVYN